MKGLEHVPEVDSDDRLALSAPGILGAAADKGVGLSASARDDEADFECPCNQPLSRFFSELPSLGMALWIVR